MFTKYFVSLLFTDKSAEDYNSSNTLVSLYFLHSDISGYGSKVQYSVVETEPGLEDAHLGHCYALDSLSTVKELAWWTVLSLFDSISLPALQSCRNSNLKTRSCSF